MNEEQPTQFWQNRSVFITGASGLVGSWLVKDLLGLGSRVVALIRDADPQSELFRSGDDRRISIVHGCVEDFNVLERAINENECDFVFHLAAQPLVRVAHRSPLPTLESNIRGTYNLLEACRVHKNIVQGVIVASSDKAYGESPILPYVEDMPLRGRFPYEVSKTCADLIAQSYFYTYDLPVAVARCGNIYGGGDLNWSRIIPGTIQSFHASKRPVIRSDGTFIRDYVYVKDVSRFYRTLAEHVRRPEVKGEAFNFSPQKPMSVLEIVRTIQEIMDCLHLEPIIENSTRGEIHSQFLSARKAESLLGWLPSYSLHAGLVETITWYRNYFMSRI